MVQKQQIIKMTWDEYFKKELNILGDKVEKYLKKNNVKIDAVVPLLRGGNIPGTYLAYRLNILKIVPVQYKYFFEDGLAELRQMQKVNEELFEKDAKTTFLLVEGNHCFGISASYAAKGLKKQFPNCQIIYATSNMDYHYQDVVKDAEVSFCGRLQNDCEESNEQECKKLGLPYKEYNIFPWENVDEELTTMKMEQYQFSDTKEAKNKSEFCESFDLSDVYK